MTVLEQETFDGLSDAETISTSNTSFDTVTGTSLDATTSAIHGTGALDISVGSSNHTCQWTTSVSGRTLLHARVYMRVTGTVGNEAWIFGCGNAAGSVAVIVMLETDGSIAIKQSNEAGNTQSSTQTFGADDELRVEWELDLDNDTQTAELFYGANIEGTTADETLTTSASMADMANWQIGRVLNRSTPIIADELAIGDAPIGPVGGGGGTTFEQSVAGSITPSAALAHQAQKTLAGSTTPDGALARLFDKLLGGDIAPDGALQQQGRKALAGTVTPTGALTRQAQAALSGSVTPTGTVATTVAKLISLAGSIAPAGVLARRTQKLVTGDTTPSGATGKSVAKALSGSTSPAGALLKLVSKVLGGSATPTGMVATSTDIVESIVAAQGTHSLIATATGTYAPTVAASGTHDLIVEAEAL